MEQFQKYPSIDNAKAGLIKKFASNDDGEWVALEKIHGANFGFVCTRDKEEVQLQRRSALLAPDEKFYGVSKHPMILALKKKVRDLFDSLAPSTVRLVVYGELFGSNVQPEIFYGPELQFVCFDILMDSHLLAYELLPPICAKFDIPLIRILRQANLKSLYDYYSNGLEQLVSLYGGGEGGGAIAEGVILRSLKVAHLVDDQEPRLMLKMKRALFTERKPAKQVDQEWGVIDEAVDFVTPGRLASVRSKLPEDEHFVKVAQALAADALQDVGKEEFWSLSSDALKKRIAKKVTDAAFVLVKSGKQQ